MTRISTYTPESPDLWFRQKEIQQLQRKSIVALGLLSAMNICCKLCQENHIKHYPDLAKTHYKGNGGGSNCAKTKTATIIKERGQFCAPAWLYFGSGQLLGYMYEVVSCMTIWPRTPSVPSASGRIAPSSIGREPKRASIFCMVCRRRRPHKTRRMQPVDSFLLSSLCT